MDPRVSSPLFRRTFLSIGVGTVLSSSIAGCVTAPGGSDDTDRRVRVVTVDDSPDIPVEPSVEVIAAAPTRSDPARLRVTVTNTADDPIQVGEERAIVFAYVHSTERPGLILLPAGESDYPAVRSGCWRLTEGIAVAEYYGVVDLDPGESTDRVVGVWGDSELTEGCLPMGRFRFETTFSGGPDQDAIGDPQWNANWGFALEVE